MISSNAASKSPASTVPMPLSDPASATASEDGRIRQEIRLAQDFQRSILPQEAPAVPGLSVAHVYQPSSEVGGDFFDFYVRAEDKLLVAVGDAFAFFGVLLGQQVVIAVPAGDAERGTGNLQARAGNPPGIDRITQGDVGIAAGAQVAGRGEPGHQGFARIVDAVKETLED